MLYKILREMISKYIYKDQYIPEEKDDRVLYTKSLQFVNCIPFMTDKMWTYIVSGITKEQLHEYIHETDNTYLLQIPECKFGSYIYNTLFQYCKTILSIQIGYNCYLLEQFSKEELLHSIQLHTVSLKAFIYFIYETHNIWHTVLNPSITIFPKCNTTNQIEYPSCTPRLIRISPFYNSDQYMNKCCSSFYKACKDCHIDCALSYIEDGLVFHKETICSIIHSNSSDFISKMVEHGMKLESYIVPISLVYKQYNVFHYCIKHINRWVYYIPECIHYVNKPITYIESIEYVCKHYSLDMGPILDKLSVQMNYYWSYIDPTKYPHTVKTCMNVVEQQYKYTAIQQIEKNISKLFIR